jgi:hypothetical protein
LCFKKATSAELFNEINFPVEPIGNEPVVGRLRFAACYEAALRTYTVRRDFLMPNLPPAPDQRLIALVVAALIAVLTLATTVEAPAAVSALPSVTASQDERFQPPQERAMPPFGVRAVLAPVESRKQPRPPGAEVAR